MNTVCTVPESTTHRREVLTRFAKLGYEWVIRYAGRYELFSEEADQANRVREIVKLDKSCPVNGMLRVGNGDNLHWFI